MKNKTKSIIILVIIVLGLLFIFTLFDWNYKSRIVQNWDNIKGDFEIINELAIDYFEKNNDNIIEVYEFKKIINSEQKKFQIEQVKIMLDIMIMEMELL